VRSEEYPRCLKYIIIPRSGVMKTQLELIVTHEVITIHTDSVHMAANLNYTENPCGYISNKCSCPCGYISFFLFSLSLYPAPPLSYTLPPFLSLYLSSPPVVYLLPSSHSLTLYLPLCLLVPHSLFLLLSPFHTLFLPLSASPLPTLQGNKCP
jgi:hypothetical protein